MRTYVVLPIAIAILLSTVCAADSPNGDSDRGPFYQVELLFRWRPDDRLYLGKSLISSACPSTDSMPALSLDDKGLPIAPPDPWGKQKGSQEMSKAGTTHIYSFSLNPEYAVPGHVSIREDDLGGNMPLPVKIGEVSITIFSGAAYRIQRISPEEAKAFEPLRNDPKFYRQRTAELRGELLGKHKVVTTASSNALAATALLLRDPGLINSVRSAFQLWIDKTPDEVKGKGYPNALSDALIQIGTVEDFKLFHQLLKRHPEEASRLTFKIPSMAKRLGLRQARPLLLVLLDNNTAMAFVNHRVTWLLRLDKTIPKPTCGDAVLSAMTREFELKPSDFGMTPIGPDDLRKLADRHDFTQRKMANMKEAGLFNGAWKDWVMLNEEDRRRGTQRMRTWINQQAG